MPKKRNEINKRISRIITFIVILSQCLVIGLIITNKKQDAARNMIFNHQLESDQLR